MNGRMIGAVAVGVALGGAVGARGGAAGHRPNVVLILADDLGPGELGYNGQEKIRTPNIDGLAKEGMRFTNAYAPSPVCGPTRCSLLTGLDQGHAYIRDNKEIKPEGQEPIPASAVTIAEVLKKGGYATACVGKWGLGMVGTSGDPLKHGFDFYYGQNCQRVAHNHYADHVWRNDERVPLDGTRYVPDLMADEAVGWLKAHREGPFFLYFATTLPHVSLQAPADEVAKYRGKVGVETPFPGRGDYVPCAEPRGTYAAMITRMDEHVGKILATLKETGVEDETLVVFASDNGPTFRVVGGQAEYFGSAMGRRGLKEDVYEGGIREPMVVRWPGHVKAGSESGFVTALYDLFPTFAEVGGVGFDQPIQGISLAPTLEGKGGQSRHPYLYWEFGPKGGQRALRKGDWKIVQVGIKKHPDAAVELYDLAHDPDETTDVSKQHPDVVKEMVGLMRGARVPAAIKAWNF